MQSNLKMLTVFSQQEPKKTYKLNEQAIVFTWDFEGFTMCKDVLGNTWIVIGAEF